MDLSLVIPVRNEAPNVAPLVAEIRAALDGIDYEVIYVDDGSSDGTAAEVRKLAQGFERLRLIRHRTSCGQSTAIRTGVKAALGEWIATLDGDGQNDPADIPSLWRLAKTHPAAGSTLFNGWRRTRRDSWQKRAASRIANAIRGWLLGDATPDTGCGLKLFRRDLYLDLPYFDHMHRFMPALVLRHGGHTVSVPVNHRPRARGASNYGTLDRLAVGVVDLLGVIWLKRRAKIPTILSEGE
jgi:dolichol-phosphate mannosyltransferase